MKPPKTLKPDGSRSSVTPLNLDTLTKQPPITALALWQLLESFIRGPNVSELEVKQLVVDVLNPKAIQLTPQGWATNFLQQCLKETGLIDKVKTKLIDNIMEFWRPEGPHRLAGFQLLPPEVHAVQLLPLSSNATAFTSPVSKSSHRSCDTFSGTTRSQAHLPQTSLHHSNIPYTCQLQHIGLMMSLNHGLKYFLDCLRCSI